jgi:hypothetical protein
MNRPPEVIKVVSEPGFTDSSMRTSGSLRNNRNWWRFFDSGFLKKTRTDSEFSNSEI